MERKLLLLGILRQQEMHGYQLLEFIERNLAACTDLKKPTAYYLLNKMAEDGWIDDELEQEGNRPPRHVYRLTPAGETAYQRLLRENLGNYEATYFPGDFGLAFLESIEPQEAFTLLRERRSKITDALSRMTAVPGHQGSFQWVIDHQVRHLTAELAWLDEILAKVAAGENSQAQQPH